jgi:hypothetical protein
MVADWVDMAAVGNGAALCSLTSLILDFAVSRVSLDSLLVLAGARFSLVCAIGYVSKKIHLTAFMLSPFCVFHKVLLLPTYPLSLHRN